MSDLTTITAIPNFAAYAPLARRTLKELPFREHKQHMALGFCGEVGELLDAVKKSAIYGKPLDKVNLAEEIGDVAWYVVNLAPELGFTASLMDIWASEFQPDPAITKLDHVDALLAVNMATAMFGVGLCDSAEPGNAIAKDTLEGLVEILCTLSHRFEIPLSVIFEANILKLQKRYGDKYSDFAALNRDLSGERTVLENSTLHAAADAVR